jgi:cytochrome c oxidase subunit 3
MRVIPIKGTMPLIQPHPYHLVEPSPWPLTSSIALMSVTLSAVLYFQGHPHAGILLGFALVSTLSTMWLWFQDIVREGTYQGFHTIKVQRSLTIGILLFIVSELFFFISIFWAFGHSSLAPTVELGAQWPPLGIHPVNPFELPLLNTVLLLSSGATVTWSHHALIWGDRRASILGLSITIILALAFTLIQAYEYYNSDLTISDGVFGSCFYFSTGFHGSHVLIGTIFLGVALLRMIKYHLTEHHHVGYEGAILYWHFVDVVWLFLFVFVYIWGGEPQ